MTADLEPVVASAAPRRQNWARTYSYRASRIVRPRDASQLLAAVATPGPVHALGTRHSFTDLPDTAGTLLDLAGLDGAVVVNDDGTATAPAWMRYGVVAQALEAEGRALHNMGSLPHISVGGAVATATHGSGDGNGALQTAVRGLRFLDASGAERAVRTGDPDFPALVVGLGAFGVITAVTLAVQSSYQVRQDLYTGLGWEAILDDLDAVTGAGYSVSVFTHWDQAQAGLVWVKSRVAPGDASSPPTHVLDATFTNDASPLGSADNVTEIGTPGPWLLRLPHFRLDREPSFGAEIQTEYFVDRRDGPDALVAVRGLAADVAPHLVVSELRTVAADTAWLSPAYERDSLAIHFTWHDRSAEVARVIPLIEQALAPFEARPHWGKVHDFEADRLAAVTPRLMDASTVYRRLDPDGRFSNAHLRRLGIR